MRIDKSIIVRGFLKRHDLEQKITLRKAEKLLKENVSSEFYEKNNYSYRVKFEGYTAFLNALLEFIDSDAGKRHYKLKKLRLGRNRKFDFLKDELKSIKKLKGLQLVAELDRIVIKYKIRPLDLITKVKAKDITHRNTKFYTLYNGKYEATQKGRDELNINDNKHDYILFNGKMYYRNRNGK